jgi:formylmethanofuran:tetrahydromethanopterin formyltransferase
MKLTPMQTVIAKMAVKADPIPDDHPVAAQLTENFGEHTFYLAEAGLLVFHPTEDSPDGQQTAQLVFIAEWTDEERTELSAIEPQPTEIAIAFAGMDDEDEELA